MSDAFKSPDKTHRSEALYSDASITVASQHTVENPWRSLSKYTAARIGLGRAGISLPTQPLLAFQLAHAKAQDAVHLPLNIEQLQKDIVDKDGCSLSTDALLLVHSQVADRDQYLQRPDLGRRLDDASRKILSAQAAVKEAPYDLAIVIVDGLSSLAIQKHVPECLSLFRKRFMSMLSDTDSQPISRLAPLIIVQQGRVAIGDEVAERLHAKAVLVLIGERPGLSSPDSLGMYLTWAPKQGLTDESRNCISNVRPEGLVYEDALEKLFYLLHEAFRLRLTGVQLKEESQTLAFEK